MDLQSDRRFVQKPVVDVLVVEKKTLTKGGHDPNSWPPSSFSEIPRKNLLTSYTILMYKLQL